MGLPLLVVDAFTSEPFRGNPAAVVVLGAAEAPPDGWMQSVAAEMRHSETAFVRPDGRGRYSLRWFTPAVEVDLCGHATLASAHVLWETGTLAGDSNAVFETRSGMLEARRRGDEIELDFPATGCEPSEPPAGLFPALGLAPAPAFRNDFYTLVEADAGTLRALTPDFVALAGVGTRAVIVTARDDCGAHDVVSRVFGPRVGIDEDPVTGSAHCMLAPFWAPRLGTATLRCEQASARGGELVVELRGDRVAIAGRAVTVTRGELLA
jgi:PhzF family phenazine biosynthesis protein